MALTTKADLLTRERELEDIAEYLRDERNFALRVQDWPRKASAERRLKVVQEKLLTVARKLAVAA